MLPQVVTALADGLGINATGFGYPLGSTMAQRLSQEPRHPTAVLFIQLIQYQVQMLFPLFCICQQTSSSQDCNGQSFLPSSPACQEKREIDCRHLLNYNLVPAPAWRPFYVALAVFSSNHLSATSMAFVR
jgi:hypothetical protein